MKQHQGIWLPDHEEHLIQWMNNSGELVDGKGTYQIKKLRAVLAKCPPERRRVCIDVGAHVGFWSMHLAKAFNRLHAFEPVLEHRQCFALNVISDNVELHPVALGNYAGNVSLNIPAGSSGGTYVNGAGSIPMKTLDEFEIHDVDLVKIDCEGFEWNVLRGGFKTITACRPVIIVEQKEHIMQKNFGARGTPAVDLLREMGYNVAQVLSGDYILEPT